MTVTLMQRRVIILFITLGLLLGPRTALAQATLLWQQSLNGTANGPDIARSVAVDTEGNVLAAGYTENTGTDRDFTVAKFAPNGTLLWQQTLNGTANGGDEASSMAVDKDGNVLAAGFTRNTGTGDDFTVVKFARDGTVLWQQTLNGTANAGDSALSVAVDKDGNVLAAGSIIGRGDFSGFSVVKFAGDGTLLWQRTPKPVLGIGDVARSVAVDKDGNVLAAGRIIGSSDFSDFTVVKFAGDGTLLWRSGTPATPDSAVGALSVAVDTEGNVLAAGDTHTAPHNDFTVAKFAPNGTLLWQQTLNGTANGFDVARSVAVDTDGNVLAAGETQNTGTSADFTVVKFAPNGTLLWQQTLNGTANGGDAASSVAVDTHGNGVLAAGYTENTDTGTDFTVVKFAPNGTLLWRQTLNGTANVGDAASSLAVDTQGDVLAAGATVNTGTGRDFTVAKFGFGSVDVTPPTLLLPTTIVVDATGPAGATVTYTVSATDDMDPNPVVICSPPSGSVFPLLASTVSCTATDATGNTATGTFQVVVLDARQQLQETIDLIATYQLTRLGTSLSDKLQLASGYIVVGNIGQACGVLTGFLNEVRAQRGKALTVDQATELTMRVSRIRNVIGC